MANNNDPKTIKISVKQKEDGDQMI